eukprot:NODE_14_length_51535_cov_1.125049.p15 type:complete len:379 gc:universal NODE_14_length_51535_cov_1.125049:40719-39583(-)
MEKLFQEFTHEFNQVKDALDQKNLSHPLTNKKKAFLTKVSPTQLKKSTKVPLKNAIAQTIPNILNESIQTDSLPFTVESLCAKLDQYQEQLDLKELEIEELKNFKKQEFKHQINFHANDTTLKLNQQILDTQIQLDSTYSKLRKCQQALDKMTVAYNLCVDDFNDMGEEYEKVADEYTKLHHEYELLLTKYKSKNDRIIELEEKLGACRNSSKVDRLEVHSSVDLLSAERQKNRNLIEQLQNSESLVRSLRLKIQEKDANNSKVDEEPSKFISIIDQQQSIIDQLGKTLKSNQIILKEIAKTPEEDKFDTINPSSRLPKSVYTASPFEFTPNSQSTSELKQQWYDTKRELASVELEEVEHALNQLEYHQLELSNMMKK